MKPIENIKLMQKAHDILIRISGDMEDLTFLQYQLMFDDSDCIEEFNGEIEKLKAKLVELTKKEYINLDT